MLDNDTIAGISGNDVLTNHCKDEWALPESDSKTFKLSRKVHSEPMNVNSMEEKKDNRFFSQHIIGSDKKIQDGLRSNKLKNGLEDEKSKEDTLETMQPLQAKTETIHEKKRAQLSKQEKYTLILIDTLISTTTIGPLVIGFWRGTWGIMDFHWDMFPSWLCFTFGVVIHTMFAFLKYQIYDHVSEEKRKSLLNRILCQFLRITYTYVFGVICVMHWRGGWNVLDKYFDLGILWINASLTTSLLVALVTLRCMRNLLAPPFLVAIDNYSRLFIFPSLCKRVSTN